MLNIITAGVGGHMAAKMDPTSESTSVVSAFEDCRVVSTVLELVATLFRSSVSSLPAPISYSITYLPLLLFGIGKSGQIQEGSEVEQGFNIIQKQHKQFIKTTVLSMAVFGVLFGRGVRMTSLVTLATFSFFTLTSSEEGKRLICSHTNLDDESINKIESLGATAASIGIIFANSSWIFKAFGVMRTLQYFDVIRGDQISTWLSQGVNWTKAQIEQISGYNLNGLIQRVADYRNSQTST
ncbi:MAG: hypothetical protein P0S95_06190 [Rhabdochlamydiaceae bacterium]|nr:hypothetical protein [Candidatus Amphrikana amoebophyrae]